MSRSETTEAMAAELPIEDWAQIPWRKLERYVYRLQKRIYQASCRGNVETVHSLQRLLMKSRAARTLAVRRVTQDNQGKRTAGVDGVKSVPAAARPALVERLRDHRTIKPQPTRRVWIPKPGQDEQRPLGMPTWSDKLLQEVIRLILESYYEPQMSPHSHGFRPGRGCHTALQEIDRTWLGTTWFLEGDVKACFDSLDHQILLETLAEKIHDGRFLRLIRELLQAGYLESWNYHATFSGAPQGGIVSPILSNIYLTKLDRYIEEHLLPAYTRGAKRRPNPAYEALHHEAARLRRSGHNDEANEVQKRAQQLPSGDPDDPDYRRLRYLRYADDWLVGFIGPKSDVEDIKRQIGAFLREVLKLELSEEKTLITHARTQAARFLGYHISTMQANTYRPHGKRYVNGKVELRIPEDVLKEKCQRYLKQGKAVHRTERETETVFSMMALYQSEYRGLVEYYQMANNLDRLNYLRWIMEQSLTKTLAAKLKISVCKVYDRFSTTHMVDGKPYKGLHAVVEREGKQPLIANWGNIPLKRNPRAVLRDDRGHIWTGHTELEKRLLADTCELCGSQDRISVHHIRALKDLHQKGRRERPLWMQVMAARRRKTLVVCWPCHMSIQHGRPRNRSQERKQHATGEPDT